MTFYNASGQGILSIGNSKYGGAARCACPHLVVFQLQLINSGHWLS